MKAASLFVPIALAHLGASAAIDASHKAKRAASGTATVDLATPSGTPSHLASGFIYGIPDSADGSVNTSIPDEFFTGMGMKYNRAGGAQLSSPSLGYIAGEFEGRFLSALSNYRTTRKFGGRFQLLLHDLWGADGVQSGDVYWPGDDDDWTAYDDFLTQVIAAIKSNSMTDGLDIDVWNEPEGSNFWGGTVAQWLAMWQRAYARFRDELPTVLLAGPSTAKPPATDNGWWRQFTNFVKTNDCIPDLYTYHVLRYASTVRDSIDGLNYWLDTVGLPERPVVINEYGAAGRNDQSPAGGAWFISQLERYNVQGLRANWASGLELHDYLANLLGKDGSRYFPVGEWWVYDYYAHNMTGQRVATNSSADDAFDVYATRGSSVDSVKVLASIRPYYGIGTYDLTIKGLSALGITDGSVQVKTLRFDYPGYRVEATGPVDLGTYKHTVDDDQITFWVTPETTATAYAFEFVV